MPVRRWTWSAPGWATWPPRTPPSWPPRPRPSACGSWSRTDAVATAARASFLAGFTAGQGYSGDADYSAVSWLMHRTGITRGAAVGHTAWAKRAATHPKVLAALAAGQVSESVGRLICLWTGKLPEKYRDESDELLLAAAAAGLGLEDLAALSAEMYERARGDLPDRGPGPGLRRPRREAGDHVRRRRGGARGPDRRSAPRWSAAVLDALSAPAGKDDDRTREQRYHDALAEAMRRLAAGGLLPERAGQPVKAWAHISLADLLRLDGNSALQEQWTAQVRARWAAHRAYASETGSDGGAWLDGDAAEAIACDAAMAPIVTGDVNVDALEDLVRLCVELDGSARAASPAGTTRPGPRSSRPSSARPSTFCPAPAGWPSFLRRRQLGARLGGPSLPLDIGYAETIPAGIRNAVMLRDRHCQWAGGCNQPAVGVRGAPHQAQGQRRQDLRQGLRAAVPVPPPGRDPPVGLDPGPEPRRDHDRVEQGQDQGPAQPRTTRPGRVTARSGRPRTSRRATRRRRPGCRW